MAVQKVVAVMGSPNGNGNTAAVVDAILNGAMGLSTNLIKYHNLGKLNYAQGCRMLHKCGGPEGCIIRDDITPILKDVLTADTVILATPVMFNLPSAQFKMVFDRFYGFIAGKPKEKSLIYGKQCIIVLVSDSLSDYNFELLEILAKSADTFGLNVISKIIYSDDGGRLSFRDDKIAVQRAFKIGSDLYRKTEHPSAADILVLNGSD